jgi:type II secretory pathway component HofQ
VYFTTELDADDVPNDTGEQLLSNTNSELKLRRIAAALLLLLLSIPENNTRGEILTSPTLSAAATDSSIKLANDGLRGGA